MLFPRLGLISLASLVYGQTQSFSAGDVTYSVNVPTTGKELFFQISGPSSMSWIGLGQGGAMAGSNIFIIYADSTGKNVTLSPRLGTGESTPSPSTSQSVSLLSGSGIVGNKMVANVKCSNCGSWSGGSMDFTSTSTNWIYAYKSGSAIKSDSASASITQHDSFDSFNFNLKAATSGSGTTNPFVTTTAAATGTGTLTGVTSGSTSTASKPASAASSSQKVVSNATIAHGIMGVLAFTFLFPMGSLSIRILNFGAANLWIHVCLQIVAYCIALAVMETGVWIAVNNGQLKLTHPLIGLVVVCGLFFQPFSGLAHHLLYKKNVAKGVRGGPNTFTYPHVAWGRIFVTLGMVNGGLGLRLTGMSMTLEVAYWVVTGIFWLAWMVIATLAMIKRHKANQNRDPFSDGRPIIRKISTASDDVRNFSRLREYRSDAFQMKNLG